MLTRQQSRLIRERGVCTLHDYWVSSLVSGEPFYEDGVLAYYDGRVVELCGFPLRGGPAPGADVLRALSERWVGRGADAVLYMGPDALQFRWLDELGYRRVERYGGDAISAELVIDCAERAGGIFSTRTYRRARAMGFASSVGRGGIVSAEHLRLVEGFYQLRQMSGYLAEIAFALPAVLRSPRVHLIDARHDGRLCGFVVLHKAFADLVVALFLAHDNRTPGVCDFLYAAMLDQASAMGASGVNIGPSPTRGHYGFKRKWGGEPAVPPYHLVRWARGQLAKRLYASWGPRLVRLR